MWVVRSLKRDETSQANRLPSFSVFRTAVLREQIETNILRLRDDVKVSRTDKCSKTTHIIIGSDHFQGCFDGHVIIFYEILQNGSKTSVGVLSLISVYYIIIYRHNLRDSLGPGNRDSAVDFRRQINTPTDNA